MRLIPYLLCFILISCGESIPPQEEIQKEEVHTWKSEYNNVKFSWKDDFEFIQPSLDSKDKMTVGLIHKNTGSAFVIKIAPDVSTDILSDEKYHRLSKEILLGKVSLGKVLNEGEVDFLNRKFYNLTYSMYNLKFSRDATVENYTKRNGSILYGMTISYDSESSKVAVYSLLDNLTLLPEL